MVSGSAEGRSKQVSRACSDVLHEGCAARDPSFGLRLPGTWGAWPCVELVVRCPVASKGLAGRGGTREKWVWVAIRASTFPLGLPLALASGVSRLRRGGTLAVGFSSVHAHENLPPHTPPGPLGGVLGVLGGHTNNHRPRASLTKHSKAQCVYAWHVLVVTQSVGVERNKEA